MSSVNDHRFAPVAGMSLETYARLSALLLKRGLSGPAAEEFLAGAGVSAATWAAARREWIARMAAHEDVRERYAVLYQGAVTAAGRSGMLAADRDDLAGHV